MGGWDSAMDLLGEPSHGEHLSSSFPQQPRALGTAGIVLVLTHGARVRSQRMEQSRR